MRIALLQINPLVGDIEGNTNKIIESIQKLIPQGVEIAVFPELSICGYPPEDLLLKPYFIKENKLYLNKIKSHCKNITAIIGYPESRYNSAAVIRDKKIIYIYHKMHLPNYGVFDEKRYFTPGTECAIFHEDDITWSVNICEDIWVEPVPTLYQTEFGKAQLIINISASPYHRGKLFEREKILTNRAKRHNVTIAYCNLVGGQDELVFDGGSLIVSPTGKVIARGKQFEEDILIQDVELEPQRRRYKKNPCIKHIKLEPLEIKEKSPISPSDIVPLTPQEEVYKALVLGTRDYIYKNGFKKAILGVSGGIDSSLTAFIAVDAIGKDNVIGLSMPSKFTSSSTLTDARLLAQNLGIRLITISIDEIFDKYLEILKPDFKDKGWDSTEENIQARIRGNLLMAFSNKFGYLVLTTGNKSETSVGYCTLYGDMAGGFAVIKDVPKQLVYELARYRNESPSPYPLRPTPRVGAPGERVGVRGIIPETVFTRPPTAELREKQKDSDSLPPYPILDPIIEAYVEQDKSFSQIVREGTDRGTALKVINLIDRNEYKRRQAPPGIKITPKAFGKDRRMPITCRIP